jgi:putative membrane protein
MKLLSKWLLSAMALLAVAHLYSGVEVQSFGSALIAAVVIGLFNTLLRPVLVILTLPVTLITLGLSLIHI